MATITGLTADRMLAIEAASVISGEVVGDNLILTRQSGSTINAGSVLGPQGDPGPAGSDLVVLTLKSILDVGLTGQIRAGRQLTAVDFTTMGLSAPIGLYNLSDVADSSGNGRSLINKNGVPFDIGINGLAATAARFTGAGTSRALYILDTGAADPFRVKTISQGCWFRTARRGVLQTMISKYGTDGNASYWMVSSVTNEAQFAITPNGTYASAKVAIGISDICDDRWHFIVGTFDGSVLRLYVDGVYEGYTQVSGSIFASSAPFNIGSLSADASVSAISPSYGLIDEAFITADVLSEDQIRNLYCARISHSLGVVPKRASINVSRLRKGAALLTTDFPTSPLRLYNFSAGALSSVGSSGNVALTNNGGAVAVAGVDGLPGNAFQFSGAQRLTATDAALPSGTNAWSFGQWFKTNSVASGGIATYGGVNDVLHWLVAGNIVSRNNVPGDDITGPFSADGEWHFVVTTAHNAPVDGVKRKLYLDGKLVGGSTVLNSITLTGAGSFQFGCSQGNANLFTGSIDGAFICDYALTADEIVALYIKGTQSLALSPKNPGDHIERLSSSHMLCIFDTLEMQHQIDLAVG